MTSSWRITAFDCRTGDIYHRIIQGDAERDRILAKLKNSGLYDNIRVDQPSPVYERPSAQTCVPRTQSQDTTKLPTKPFSTYPEDREKLIKLADVVLDNALAGLESNDAVELADLVKSILEDEQHRDENT